MYLKMECHGWLQKYISVALYRQAVSERVPMCDAQSIMGKKLSLHIRRPIIYCCVCWKHCLGEDAVNWCNKNKQQFIYQRKGSSRHFEMIQNVRLWVVSLGLCTPRENQSSGYKNNFVTEELPVWIPVFLFRNISQWLSCYSSHIINILPFGKCVEPTFLE